MALAICWLAAAELDLRRTLANQPSDAFTRLFLARTLVELGRVEEALVEIDRALSTQTDPEIQFQAGSIVRELAERRFANLKRLAPDSAAVHELAGRYFEQQGKLADALQEYRAAIAKEPNRPGLHFAAGNLLCRMRELDAAEQELQAELARAPHHGMANLRLGQLFVMRNQAAQAVPFFEHAVDALPESVDARRELGKAYRQLGDTERARHELNRHREILKNRQKR